MDDVTYVVIWRETGRLYGPYTSVADAISARDLLCEVIGGDPLISIRRLRSAQHDAAQHLRESAAAIKSKAAEMNISIS